MKNMLSVLCLVLLAGCVYGHEGHKAVVVLQGKGVEGYVVFTHDGDLVRGEGKVTGLKPGKHGFHVHASGDLREGCASTLGHFNPFNKHHGAPEDDERHVGDLGNIFADSEGVAIVKFEDKLISLHGDLSIIGRAVVVHEGEDDLGRGNTKDSLTTGNAGGRVACGIIGTLFEYMSSSCRIGYNLWLLVFATATVLKWL